MFYIKYIIINVNPLSIAIMSGFTLINLARNICLVKFETIREIRASI
jgi:hypothetical protein